MKFKSKYFLAPLMAISLAAAPVTQAEARGYGHGGYHGGHRGGYHHNGGWGAAAAITGALVGTALLVDALSPRYYAPEPAYYPQETYYAPRPVYYQPAPRYYVQGPYGYYAPAAAYYPY